jgi:WD40 repeat protein
MRRTLRGHTARIRSLKFVPDGKTLISSADDGTIHLWDPESDEPREVIALGPPNRSLEFDLDPTGKYLAAGGSAPVVFLLRLPATAEQAAVIQSPFHQ